MLRSLVAFSVVALALAGCSSESVDAPIVETSPVSASSTVNPPAPANPAYTDDGPQAAWTTSARSGLIIPLEDLATNLDNGDSLLPGWSIQAGAPDQPTQTVTSNLNAASEPGCQRLAEVFSAGRPLLFRYVGAEGGDARQAVIAIETLPDPAAYAELMKRVRDCESYVDPEESVRFTLDYVEVPPLGEAGHAYRGSIAPVDADGEPEGEPAQAQDCISFLRGDAQGRVCVTPPAGDPPATAPSEMETARELAGALLERMDAGCH